MKKLMTLILVVCLLLTTQLEACKANPTSSWWSTNWSIRREVALTTANENNQNDYAVLLHVNYDSEMRTDFGDIRFTYCDESLGSEKETHYWIQEKSDGIFANVWVKVPLVKASSTTILYMYYKNPSATTASNGTNTFWFFDDFDNDNYTSDGWAAWNSWGSGGQWTESGTVIQQVGGTTGDAILSHSIPEISNYEMQVKAKPEQWTEDAVFVGTGDYTTGSGTGQEMAVGINWNYLGVTGRYWGITNTTGEGGPIAAWAYVEAPISLDEWYTFRLVANGTAYGWVSNSTGEYFVGSPKGASPSINGVHFKANPMQRYASYDWVVVRKYSYPEPAYTIGSPETPTSEAPFWTRWWFWTIIALVAIVVVLAFTTFRYCKKPSISKETGAMQSKMAQKASKICPKCGANLPADSKFCGKCGTSLE